jgi:murein DD-endopeptidase MepM/ murein hydrolase activator NlpD
MLARAATALALVLVALVGVLPAGAQAKTDSAGGGIEYNPGPSLAPGTLGSESAGTRYLPYVSRTAARRRTARPQSPRRRSARRRGARRQGIRRRANRRRAARKAPSRARPTAPSLPNVPAPQPNEVAPRTTGPHAFPVAGQYSLGNEESRFGAKRGKRRHAGHDILAAEGTPVVAPRGGIISWRAFQKQGAGHYLVLDAADEPYDYVFMHLRSGSMLVNVGQVVRTGQALAQVGSTGSSSTPHLHFEIWDGPWFNGGQPVDPLPFLLSWQ